MKLFVKKSKSLIASYDLDVFTLSNQSNKTKSRKNIFCLKSETLFSNSLNSIILDLFQRATNES